MTTPVLHYIYDPLCGWCYGAKPLIDAARGIVPVVAHGGGMMTGAQRRPVSAQLRDYVMPHDQRIAEYTGQPFGEAYFEGLLRDTTAVFDSAPPITAVLAAEQLAGRGLELLGRLQTAHYVEGRRISDKNVLEELATEIGLPTEAFVTAYQAARGEPTHTHIKDSRKLLGQVGAKAFLPWFWNLTGATKWSILGRLSVSQMPLRNGCAHPPKAQTIQRPPAA